MKRTILSFVFAALVSQTQADDSAYRTALDSVHERFRILEAQRSDYRKSTPGLPPAEEDERLRLLGQLLTDDPVWALAQEIQADITAMKRLIPLTPEDGASFENLKEFLAYVAGFEERAMTREQAEQFATTLRQFVVRRDITGLRNWSKSQ